MTNTKSGRLEDVAPDLAKVLKRPEVLAPPQFGASDITVQTVMVPMRDGIRLATDLYLPPGGPAPAVAMRTPYGREQDPSVSVFMALARRGFVIAAQDCRGTGGSEPDDFDYYVREPEDGYDFVEWISQQEWFDGFVGGAGGSYVGQTQWQMAVHPKMSTIIPEVSGLGVGINTARLHMFLNAFTRSVGKGEDKLGVPFEELEGLILDETLATGFFNEPLNKPLPETVLKRFPELQELSPWKAQDWLWAHYCSLTCAGRADFIKEVTGAPRVSIIDIESMPATFGHRISHDRHTLPHTQMEELVGSLHAPVLFSTGWYDWGLNDAFATWDLIQRAAPEPMRSNCRLFVAPSAHNMPGYHEGADRHPELRHAFRLGANLELQRRWNETVRRGEVSTWPTVIYYLMGANEWRTADSWPISEATGARFYLGSGGTLSTEEPQGESEPDRYTYDPEQPTPTVGGSIVSYVYPPGSADVSEVQQRPDVLTYTTAPLDHDLDVVGPLRVILYAASNVTDTDFVCRLTDVFPDGRAIQIQNGALRARYRNTYGEPELLEPGRVYQLEIDMWATANRFKAGHRLRVDIASADFPRWDRNTNRGGEPGAPIPAEQTIYHDAEHPSHLEVQILP
jgi:uncharacterized protein